LLKLTAAAPELAGPFINLAVIHIKRHEPDKALALLNRALLLEPDSAWPHLHKGVALNQKGEFEAALKSYEQAVRLRPDLEPKVQQAMQEIKAGIAPIN
jgi:Flp pilus assembly protein TadD